MNGYFVSITNNLLEDKHFEKMGNAVWLYMWLIDKMTDISEGEGIVNNGHPVTYEMVADKFTSLELRTYQRMIKKLRDGGYINTVRAQHGLYFTINKAKKQFGKKVESGYDKSVASKQKKEPEIRQKRRQDTPKLSRSSAKNVASLYIDNKYNNNTSNNSTNVLGEKSPKSFGKPEINEMFDYWEEMTGNKITAQIPNNRRAANNLLKKHGKENLKKMIGGVAYSHGERYAPSIANFVQLQAKWDDLIVWGKRHQKGRKGGVYKV